jgi:hypothetical protein
MDLPPGKHWMDWYLAALNGEQEHQDWLDQRKARAASRQTSGLRPA